MGLDLKTPKQKQEEESRKIKEWGKRLNKRARDQSIEERQNQSWVEMLEELNVPHYVG